MLTKEDKTLIKRSGNQKKYGVKRLDKEFPNKKWSRRDVEDFQKRLRTTGPLNEHPVVDVRAQRALLRTFTLWRTWYRARRINPRHTAPVDRSHESSEYLKQITGDYFSVLLSYERKWTKNNGVLTEECCYLNLRSTVRTQLRWCGKFYYSRM